MDVFVVLGLVAAAAYVFLNKADSTMFGAAASAATGEPLTGDDLVNDAIRQGIVGPLNLPDSATPILRAQAILETGHYTAGYLPKTKSLFNRHIGSGRGEWIGAGKSRDALVEGVDYVYVSPGDPDLRCFVDYYQCCRDMAQLLQDPLYNAALAGLQRGSAPDYFNALHAAGFSTQDSYAVALQRTYDAIA